MPNSQLVYSGVDDNVERSRPVPSRLAVFLQPSRQRYRGRRPRKIDQLMPIVAEIEQIPSPMVQLVVNGTKVETQADPGMPLLWFLRDTC